MPQQKPLVVDNGTTQNLPAGDQLEVNAGTAALPALTIDNDPNTGLYSPAADQLAVATGGVQRMNVTSSGVTIGAFTLPLTDGTASQVLQTNGSGAVSWATVSGGGGTPASPTNSVQFNNAGAFGGSANLTWNNAQTRLGIGTASPSGTLEVAGGTATTGAGTSISLTAQSGAASNNNGGGISLTAGAATGIGTAGSVSIVSGSGAAIGTPGSIIMRSGAQQNSQTAFQVQNSSSTTILNVDTINQRVGIGTTTPTGPLHVVSSAPSSGNSGGPITLTAQNGGSGIAAGGDVLITSGASTGTATAGSIILTGAAAPGVGSGGSINLTAGNSTSGLSGDITLVSGGLGGVPNPGQIVVRPGGNRTTAFQVQTAGSAVVLNVDTTNQRVGIGTAAPSGPFQVVGGTQATASTAGAPITLTGQTGGSGNANGGDILLVGGTRTGTGTGGSVIARAGTDSATAFQVQTTGSVSVLNVDTTNQRVGVLTTTPLASFDVLGNTLFRGTVTARNTSDSANAYMFQRLATDSGTATGTQTGTTLQDTSKTWGVNQYVGALVTTTGGTGSGQTRTVTSNTANTLTVTPAWSPTLVSGSTTYAVSGSTLLNVDTTNQRVSVGGVAGTHTFNVGSGASANFCVASGGRIHTYDGSAPTNGQVLIGDTALGNFAKAALTAGTGIAITNGAGSITIAASNAGGVQPITTISANTTLGASNYTVLCNGGLTVSLPAAASNTGRVYNIKKIDTGGPGQNTIIDPNGAETIDGAATYTLTTQYESVTIQCNGTEWFIL